MLQKTGITFLAVLLVLTVWGCDDDSPTGPNLDEVPDSPTMEEVDMDFSVFSNAQNYGAHKIMDSEDFDQVRTFLQNNPADNPYEQAALMAFAAESWFQVLGQFPNTYFRQNQWGDPERDGDTWIWEWQVNIEGESVSMVITAEPVGDERHWEMRYSAQGVEGQDDFEDVLFIAAQVALDGSGGAWQMYNFTSEPDDPVFSMDYALNEDLTTMVDLRFQEEDDDDSRILYESDGATGSLQLWGLYGNQSHSLLNWNNDTGTGSIESPDFRDGERICWNDSYQETDC